MVATVIRRHFNRDDDDDDDNDNAKIRSCAVLLCVVSRIILFIFSSIYIRESQHGADDTLSSIEFTDIGINA